ncbi:MAG: transposase [Microgenomates group bacterium]
MPSRNALKEYEAGGYYHIYNRGVAKQIVFERDKDYKTFLSYLQLYLVPPPALQGQSSQAQQIRTSPSKQLKNYAGEITLLAYCLMPNHFHLLLRQNSDHGMDHFMRSLITKYVRYFNSHYDRVGHLFQDRYKAVHITSEAQFTYVSKYIHRNPLDLPACKDSPRRLIDYTYSSYGNYLHLFEQTWVSTEDILSYFSKTNPRSSYQSFVEESSQDDVKFIADLALDLL